MADDNSAAFYDEALTHVEQKARGLAAAISGGAPKPWAYRRLEVRSRVSDLSKGYVTWTGEAFFDRGSRKAQRRILVRVVVLDGGGGYLQVLRHMRKRLHRALFNAEIGAFDTGRIMKEVRRTPTAWDEASGMSTPDVNLTGDADATAQARCA